MSQEKNSTEVCIAGKIYTVAGYEEEDYIQKVAAYINTKISDLKQSGDFLRQGPDFFHMMVELNLADDYFKIRRHADMLEKKLDDMEKELYGLKHDLVSAQMKLEKQEQETSEWQSISEDLAEQVEQMKQEQKVEQRTEREAVENSGN